jgi:endonuclease YncB( thermonuclease family)
MLTRRPSESAPRFCGAQRSKAIGPIRPCSRFAFFAALALLAHEPKTITRKVVSIADGDRLMVLDDAKVEHRIRLNGNDTPEKVQTFARKAWENLAAKLFCWSFTSV